MLALIAIVAIVAMVFLGQQISAILSSIGESLGLTSPASGNVPNGNAWGFWK